jgi:hypothetical protein
MTPAIIRYHQRTTLSRCGHRMLEVTRKTNSFPLTFLSYYYIVANKLVTSSHSSHAFKFQMVLKLTNGTRRRYSVACLPLSVSTQHLLLPLSTRESINNIFSILRLTYYSVYTTNITETISTFIFNSPM